MKLITRIEVREVPGKQCKVFYPTSADRPFLNLSPGSHAERDLIDSEMVHGQDFIDHRTGAVITVGMTKAVESVLGLPFQAIHDMHDRIVNLLKWNQFLDKTIGGLQDKLNQGYTEYDALVNMPWYRRIVFLFAGWRYLK